MFKYSSGSQVATLNINGSVVVYGFPSSRQTV